MFFVQTRDLSCKALLRPIFLLGNPLVLLSLPSYLTRTCFLGFFLGLFLRVFFSAYVFKSFFCEALFPILVQNVALIPYVTISTALCQIGLGLVTVFFWDRVSFVLGVLFFSKKN